MKLSVIIPVYNQEDLIRRAIASVPDVPEIEVIVIDDGSTDGTMETIREIGKYRNIHCIQSSENRGVSAARNKGLDVAHGEYVMMLDSDDYIITEHFNLDDLDGTDMIYYDLRVNNGGFIPLTPKTRTHFVGTTKFIKRLLIGNTRYPEDKRVLEDAVFWNELNSKQHTEKFLGKTVIHYNWPRVGSLCWQQSRGEI